MSLTVSGITDRASQDITITVTAPNGNVVTVDQISPILMENSVSNHSWWTIMERRWILYCNCTTI